MDSVVLVKTRTTIMDVARVSGVSKTTVSVIMNDSPASTRLPVDTRQRVRAAAEQLGYRPNWRARALANRRTRMIGIMYAPPMPIVIRGNYESIMTGINQVLVERGYHMLFAPLGSNKAEWSHVFLDQRIDGCLILSRLIEPMPELLQKSWLPAVLVNAQTDLPVSLVNPDDFQGAQELTEYLIGLGHKKITYFVGPQPPHFSIGLRRDGYSAAMRTADLEQYIRRVEGPFDEMMEHVRRDKPTAVIVYTHFAVMKLLRLLWDAGVRVPQDISVATFSNVFPVEDTIPPLTVMALPTEEIGRTAATMVLDRIESEGTEAPAPERVILKETLIVRKSTAPPAA